VLLVWLGSAGMINHGLQWVGTTIFISMYIVMSFFPDLHPLEIALGMVGGICYLTWSIRVMNKPQIIVNIAGVFVCGCGLINFWK
jgi:hypothetical protein